jgi:hypothetical protein
VTATSIHRKNAWVLAALVAGALPFGGKAVAGAALGGAIQCLNLRALERCVGAIASAARPGAALLARALVASRWLFLLAAVGAALVASPVHPLALLVGLSSAVPAALWHGLAASRAGAPAIE